MLVPCVGSSRRQAYGAKTVSCDEQRRICRPVCFGDPGTGSGKLKQVGCAVGASRGVCIAAQVNIGHYLAPVKNSPTCFENLSESVHCATVTALAATTTGHQSHPLWRNLRQVGLCRPQRSNRLTRLKRSPAKLGGNEHPANQAGPSSWPAASDHCT